MKRGKMTANAKAFMAANRQRGVVEGSVTGPHGGATYRLKGGQTFVDNVTREPTHINVTYLLEVVRRSSLEPMRCEIGESLADGLKAGNLGVEEPHALKLPVEALEVPILVCEWGDSHVIADGAHRLWRRWKAGETHFPAYVIPERVWRAFIIPNEVVGGDGAYWDDFNRNAKVRS